jgi:hypothetical protein
LVAARDEVRDSDTDGHMYTIETLSILRGEIGSSFQVWEENSSGRAPFRWTTGVDYLLFLSYSQTASAWVIDGCGNSGPLNGSATVLASVRAARTNTVDGVVEGMVSTDSWTTGVPNVAVSAISDSTTLTATTDQNGRFRMRLPIGNYRLEANRSGWSFVPEPFSYENPNDLRITRNYCAQVQFSGAPAK